MYLFPVDIAKGNALKLQKTSFIIEKPAVYGLFPLLPNGMNYIHSLFLLCLQVSITITIPPYSSPTLNFPNLFQARINIWDAYKVAT